MDDQKNGPGEEDGADKEGWNLDSSDNTRVTKHTKLELQEHTYADDVNLTDLGNAHRMAIIYTTTLHFFSRSSENLRSECD